MKRRGNWLISIILIVLILEGASDCDGPSNNVVVPSSDPTPPTIVMDVVGIDPEISVTSSSASVSAAIGNNLQVSVVADGQDPDGGMQATEIWATFTKYKADGTIEGPGLAGGPVTASRDTPKQPGDTALKSRLLLYALDFQELGRGYIRVDVVVWARAINCLGNQVDTARVTLRWTRSP